MKRQLTFSIGAHLVVIGFALLGLCMVGWAYLEIYDHFDKTGSIVIERICRPKSAWFCEIDQFGGGYPGLLLLFSLAVVAVYGIAQSVLRLFGSHVAATCDDDQLYFHPTVSRRGPVSIDNVTAVWTDFPISNKKFNTSVMTLGRERTLWLSFVDTDGKARKVYFDANRIAGGRQSLIEFRRNLKSLMRDSG